MSWSMRMRGIVARTQNTVKIRTPVFTKVRPS